MVAAKPQTDAEVWLSFPGGQTDCLPVRRSSFAGPFGGCSVLLGAAQGSAVLRAKHIIIPHYSAEASQGPLARGTWARCLRDARPGESGSPHHGRGSSVTASHRRDGSAQENGGVHGPPWAQRRAHDTAQVVVVGPGRESRAPSSIRVCLTPCQRASVCQRARYRHVPPCSQRDIVAA